MKRHYRLRRNSHFLRVRRFGKTYASPLMVLAFVRNELNHSRFGFVVSKRLGNAVQRNKVKRRLREATRVRLPSIKSGFDLVFIARRPITQAAYEEIEQSLEHLLMKADLFIGQPAHSQAPIHTSLDPSDNQRQGAKKQGFFGK